MSKRKIVWWSILGALLLVGGVWLGSHLLRTPPTDTTPPLDNSADTEPTKSVGEQLLDASDQKTVSEIVQKYDLEVEYDAITNEYNIFDVAFFSRNIQLLYRFDENDAVSYVGVYTPLFAYQSGTEEVVAYTAEELQSAIYTVWGELQQYLGVNTEFCDIVPVADGEALDAQDITAYESIKNREAYFQFSAKDTDGSLWLMQVYIEESGVVTTFVEHDVSLELYAGFVPNIYLE